MASEQFCETCGLAVPPDASVCPRDGTVMLSREPLPSASSEAPAFLPASQAPEQDGLIGLRLGEYELRQRIGVGGMGLVYEGIQPLIGKRVAVKVLRPELAQAPEQVARLLAEARAVNAIRHRGIIDIFGFGQVPDGRQYIIMEFLEGQALDSYLAERGRLAVQETLAILDEVLAALGAAHGAGVVHRDLKPSNIFLVRQPDGSRYVKLLDFGLAKQAQTPTGRTAQTRTDMVVGTPEYMAPEQARGQEVGPMTDLYALGVVSFEMVTGQLPFTANSPVDLLLKHVDARPPRPSEFVPELPQSLDAFILQMLTKDPETRPGSADALRQQLQRLRRNLARLPRGTSPRPPAPPPAPEAPPPAPPQAPPPPQASSEDASRHVTTALPSLSGERLRPRRLLPLGLGAAVLLGLGGAAVVYRSRPAPAPRPVQAPEPFVVTPSPRPEPVAPQPSPPEPPPAVAAQPPATPPAPQEAPPSAEAPAVADPPREPAVADAPRPQPRPRPRETPEATGPSQGVLLARIQMLERDVEARIAAGEQMSPATRTTLEQLRDEALEARDARTRRELATRLSTWERLFLKRR